MTILSRVLCLLAFTSSLVQADPVTPDGMRLSLTRDGFQTLSQTLSRHILQDIHDQTLADFTSDLGSGVHGDFSGIRFSVDFGDVHIVPDKKGLLFDIDVNRLKLRLDRARFYAQFGITISTTCRETEAEISGPNPVRLHLRGTPRVVDGTVFVDTRDVDLLMDSSQFQVKGPRSCSGILGIGELMKFAVHQTLARSQATIRTRIVEAVGGAGPELAKAINGLFAKPFPITVGGLPGMPETRLLLAVKPGAIDVDEERAVFPLSVAVSMDNSTSHNLIEPNLDPGLAVETIVANLGLRAGVINELLEKIVPRMPYTIDVDPGQSSVLREIFSRQGLSVILPDLNRVAMDDDVIHARLGFGATPFLSFGEGPSGQPRLTLTLPDLRLMLSVQQDGQQHPYFNLAFGVSFPIAVQLRGDNLRLIPEPEARIAVSGSWDPTYHPELDIFEADVAQMIFGRALDVLCLGGPLAHFTIPPVAVDPETPVRIRRPQVKEGYLGVELVKP